MYKQRDALRDVISEACQSSFQKRKSVSLLPDVDEFGMYLSLAFDHFAQTLDQPFDYVKASIQSRPPPETLEDNLLEFVVSFAAATNAEGDIEHIFHKITKIVASYFILDSARKHRMGRLIAVCLWRKTPNYLPHDAQVSNDHSAQANRRTGSKPNIPTSIQASTRRLDTKTTRTEEYAFPCSRNILIIMSHVNLRCQVSSPSAKASGANKSGPRMATLSAAITTQASIECIEAC